MEDVTFQTIAVVPIASPVLCLRAVDPSQSLLLLSLPSSFHLLNWSTRQRIVVHMVTEEEEELWNGVVGATFLTSTHILVLKAHSIEVCTLLDLDDPRQKEAHTGPRNGNFADYITHSTHPSERHMRAIVHSHYLPSTTFRGASLARPTLHSAIRSPDTTWHHPEPIRVSTSFLAFDVLRGLFHFSVSVTLPHTYAESQTSHEVPVPIDVHIDLLSSHNMAVPVSTYSLHTDGTSTLSPATGTVLRSGFSHGTRGFVFACALGPTGRRGVWVERRRGEVRRVVYGFDATITALSDTKDTPGNVAAATNPAEDPQSVVESTSGLAERAEAIHGYEVYQVNSYDLGDDITHIAFAEAAGIIALGTRKGDIRVLGRGVAAE
ncbi:hypothetical protein GY45DRAFT_1248457 [Cubamyces sp. BRFM 1775]|nr:hypothetical protein GY45DRAFT_1248457 [Cubamyces sp. BRFM 1775]